MNDAKLRKLKGRLRDLVEARRRKRLRETPCSVCGMLPLSSTIIVDTLHEEANCEECMRIAGRVYGDDLTVVRMPLPLPGECLEKADEMAAGGPDEAA